MFKKFYCLIIIFSLVLPCIINAEEEKVYELEEIEVTATRIGQSLRDIPIATKVITQEDIKASNANNVADVIKDAVGVEIKSYGTLGSLNTVSLRGSTSDQVLVLIDGRPVNSISTGSANLSEISLDNIEKIEI
ncbi:MAG: TonB-dependent receptor, partial [Candidatus Firestonebacteria bacterium]|nr:TonB-dependent receptor [Candidatus Firestonebacteria bacterium]